MTAPVKANKVRRASPPIFALYRPRPPLGGFTKEISSPRAGRRRLLLLPEKNAGSKVRGLAAPATLRLQCAKRKPSEGIRGLPADFFGAIPVASALGAAPGATPPRQFQLIMGVLLQPPKPELSTLLGIGIFYFALTSIVSQV